MISVYRTKNVYSLQTNALVAIILIIALVIYMYLMCRGYLSILAQDELNKKEREGVHVVTNTNDLLQKIKKDQKAIA